MVLIDTVLQSPIAYVPLSDRYFAISSLFCDM